MKKIMTVILVSCILVMSCNDDFVELNPISTVSVDVLYKTDKDFQDAVIGIYSTLQNEYQNHWIYADVRSDDSEQQVVKNDPWYLSDAFILNNDATLLRDTWLNYYVMINRSNTLLSKIEAMDPAVIKNKDRHIGETKFLRAFAYFDLVRLFGDVPMITTPISTEQAYKTGREKVNKIYEEIIIPDLLEAEGKLPPGYTGADVGRATKGAAKALLGRVYLTRKDFQKAETKLQEVTTMGYLLLQKYNDLFDYAKNEHHSEYIFDIEYEQGIGEGSMFTNRFMPNFATMADFYGVKGGLTETNSPTEDLIAAFAPEDLRRDITVGTKGGFYDANGVFRSLPQATSQTYTKKYLTSVPLVNDSRANWKVIRYADVLLMYAEALARNSKVSDALGYLNQVRQRAGLTGYAGLTQAETLEKIYLERRLELSFEGQRWFDLVRTDRAYDVMKSKGMLPYMTVFPIPLSQIQIINNRTIFPQNEGYD